MNAPATAPTGPSTTAPDTAPSAALPARSCALASSGKNEAATSAPTSSFFIAQFPKPSTGHRNVKLRRQKGATAAAAARFTSDAKKPATGSRRGLNYLDVENMPVICPTCQIFSGAPNALVLHQVKRRSYRQLIGWLRHPRDHRRDPEQTIVVVVHPVEVEPDDRLGERF